METGLTPPKPIKIAVASDIHAYSSDTASPSHLRVGMSEAVILQHPISSLLELIDAEKITADILLSPGDLGDKADPQGIAYSWAALSKISQRLGCTFFTATAGNHDMDSRLKTSNHKPQHILKGLVPSFPFQDETLDNKYWAKDYAIRDIGSLRLVNLNSSSSHGYSKTEEDHGRIDEQTLDFLTKELASLPRMPINILLCHHHPHHHSELDLGEGDVMKCGQQLLDLLGSGDNGRWLVIHGHKHHPKIAYAAGGSASAVVFAAGSLCAILSGKLQTAARNQFYLLEIDPSLCDTYGLVGRVNAWDWSAGNGWIRANTLGSGLPALFGFGNRQDPLVVANNLAELVLSAPDSVSWKAIVQALPATAYLLPQDLLELIRILQAKYGLAVQKDGTSIIEVGRQVP
jgi:predicted MPP superfamily phosphohydrolase